MVYKNTAVYTIKKGCPWYEMQQFFGPPNVNWCEPTSCSIVNEPATAWSNFGMIIPGLVIFYFSRAYKSQAIKYFGISVFIMGLFSFIYHSTNNLGTQFLDFIGMYIYTTVMIVINLLRMRKANKTNQYKFYWGIIALNGILFPLFLKMGWGIQFIVVLNIFAVLGTEIAANLKDKSVGKSGYKYKSFFGSLFFISLAQAFSLADHTRMWCNPQNALLHGHAIWHVLAGVSCIFSFLHYRQFDEYLFEIENEVVVSNAEVRV